MIISFKRFLTLLLIFFHTQLFAPKFEQPQKMIVSVLVADIKTCPRETSSEYKKQDNSRISQALLGEHVLGLEYEQDWIKAEFLEQKTLNTFTKNFNWGNVVGWVKKDQVRTVTEFPIYNLVTRNKQNPIYLDTSKKSLLLKLPMGIKLLAENIDINFWKIYLTDGTIGIIESNNVCELKIDKIEDEQTLRENIIKTAQLFLTDPYLWKGRSCYDKDIKTALTSVDCAGLVNLVYRANGLEIPRNPECQYIKSKEISINQLQPGDLIFWATSTNPNKIVHTMMYTGNNKVIESPRVNTKVRECSFEDRVKYHIKIGRIVSYFGSFLNSPEIVKSLREAAITDTYTDVSDNKFIKNSRQKRHS